MSGICVDAAALAAGAASVGNVFVFMDSFLYNQVVPCLSVLAARDRPAHASTNIKMDMVVVCIQSYVVFMLIELYLSIVYESTTYY